jgi:hypothetical protein
MLNKLSHKFKYTKFEDAKIGDVMSYHNLYFYKILNKGKKLNNNWIHCELIRESDIHSKESRSQCIRPQTYKFFDNDLVWCRTFVVADPNNPGKYYHVDNPKLNDIILDIDNKLYQLIDFKANKTYDMG